MKNDLKKLIEKFRETALVHGKAAGEDDYKSANRYFDKIIALLPKILSHGSIGEAALLALTEDQDPSVACWAATYSLKFDANRALAVLGKLSKMPGVIGFDAKMVLELWQEGNLVLA